MLCLDNLVAQSRTVWYEYLQLLLALLLLLAEHLLVGIESGFSFCLTGFRSHVCPFQLAFEGFAALRSLFFLLHHALSFLLQPRGVVAVPWYALATVELQDPLAHVVEEVAVVGNGDYRSLILLQVLFQPVDALGIEVVGRLVEQQHIGLLQEQTAEGHAAALTTGEVGNGQVALRAAQCCHGAVELGIHVPCVGGVDNVLHFSLALHQLVHLVGVGIVFLHTELLVYLFVFGKGVIRALHALHYVLLHGLCLVEWRILRQIAHAVSRAPHHFALCRLLQSGDDFHES